MVLRLVSWNICHGGGKRYPEIIAQLRSWQPDVVGLSEFRGTAPSQSIATALSEMGLTHQHSTVDSTAPNNDRLLLASRYPFAIQTPSVYPHFGRWIHATLDGEITWTLIVMWVPNRDLTGVKYAFHDAVVQSLRPLAGQAGLAFGDTNTGAPVLDEEASFFNVREGQWYKNLAQAGWIDLWRDRYPDRREYTWHTPGSGTGFRIDQVFATGYTNQYIRDVRYEWGSPPVGKLRGPSDHAAIIVDLH